jgi:hypothetical protein
VTPAVLDRPARQRSPGDCAQDRGRPQTLERLLTSTLAAAEAGLGPDCPVCGGAMALAGAESVCGGCGSRLG